jgi:PST family polysaccharide transporter
MDVRNEDWTRYLPESLRQRLHGRVQLQKILSNTIWLSFDRIVRLGLSAIVGIWMARTLGKAQFGLLNYAAAFVALFTPLANLGFESIIVRDVIVESPGEVRVTMGTAFVMRLVGGGLALLFSAVVMTYVRPGDGLTFWLVLIMAASMVFQAFDVIDFWFQSIVKSKFTIYARNSAFLLSNVLRAYFLLAGSSVIYFGGAALIEIVLGAIGLIIVYKIRGNTVFDWKARWDRAGKFMKDCWPLAFASIAVTLYMKIGQVMVGDMLGNAANGVYAVAVRLAEIWYFIPTALSASVFPSLIKNRVQDPESYRARLQHLYDIMSAISIAVGIVTSLVATKVVVMLYGAQYAEAGPVLALYIWASLPVFLGVASSQYLVAEGYTKLAMSRTVIGAILSIAMNLLLIPRFGNIGAATATLLSYTCSTFVIVFDRDARGQALAMVRSFNIVRTLSSGLAQIRK